MSKCENCSPSDGSYASSFKPAKVRGGPTLQELRNQFYISQHKEVIHPKGWPQYMGDVHELNETGFSTDEFDKMSDIFKLEPADPLGRMEVRRVKLVNSGQDGDLTFLVNSDIESRGLVTITIGPIPENDKQSKCNIRILPFSKYSELLQPPYHGDKYPRLLLPKDNIIKLDVTLEYTDLGEVRYRTRGTEVTVENMDDEQKTALKRNLEYNGAEKVSSLLRSLAFERKSSQDLPEGGGSTPTLATTPINGALNQSAVQLDTPVTSIIILCGTVAGILILACITKSIIKCLKADSAHDAGATSENSRLLRQIDSEISPISHLSQNTSFSQNSLIDLLSRNGQSTTLDTL